MNFTNRGEKERFIQSVDKILKNRSEGIAGRKTGCITEVLEEVFKESTGNKCY
ncbi:MAG: hypothetical protein ACLU48_04265 [Clostridiaceae bacterium]